MALSGCLTYLTLSDTCGRGKGRPFCDYLAKIEGGEGQEWREEQSRRNVAREERRQHRSLHWEIRARGDSGGSRSESIFLEWDFFSIFCSTA